MPFLPPKRFDATPAKQAAYRRSSAADCAQQNVQHSGKLPQSSNEYSRFSLYQRD
ncbi:hypothetical protein H6F67_12615 [Microcoleus sp. FACHB-1515]|uniref:hypothetical protein n=2 Tax=Cyanophyceae TaxID=3028117 RepID=UPI0019A77455|nr:hypothetical protein [Microcoleus sp. FACHB-1515]MBD2090697.1 hypothetical protein [Microcoleus sp. FACHB-1515]